jgi:hypothetical protein
METPAFNLWNRDELNRFAMEAYLQMQMDHEAKEQLRLDLRDAMKLLREQRNKDDWK